MKEFNKYNSMMLCKLVTIIRVSDTLLFHLKIANTVNRISLFLVSILFPVSNGTNDLLLRLHSF